MKMQQMIVWMIWLHPRSPKSRRKTRQALKKSNSVFFGDAKTKKKLLLSASVSDPQGKQVVKRKITKEVNPKELQPKNLLKNPEALSDSDKKLKSKPQNERKSIPQRSNTDKNPRMLENNTNKDEIDEFGSTNDGKKVAAYRKSPTINASQITTNNPNDTKPYVTSTKSYDSEKQTKLRRLTVKRSVVYAKSSRDQTTNFAKKKPSWNPNSTERRYY